MENHWAGAHLPSTLHLKTVERPSRIFQGERGEEGEIKAFPPNSTEAKAPNFLFPPHSGRLQNHKGLFGPPCPP